MKLKGTKKTPVDKDWFGEKVYSDIIMLSLLLKEGNSSRMKLMNKAGDSMKAEARLWIWENSLDEYRVGWMITHGRR